MTLITNKRSEDEAGVSISPDLPWSANFSVSNSGHKILLGMCTTSAYIYGIISSQNAYEFYWVFLGKSNMPSGVQ